MKVNESSAQGREKIVNAPDSIKNYASGDSTSGASQCHNLWFGKKRDWPWLAGVVGD